METETKGVENLRLGRESVEGNTLHLCVSMCAHTGTHGYVVKSGKRKSRSVKVVVTRKGKWTDVMESSNIIEEGQ